MPNYSEADLDVTRARIALTGTLHDDMIVRKLDGELIPWRYVPYMLRVDVLEALGVGDFSTVEELVAKWEDINDRHQDP